CTWSRPTEVASSARSSRSSSASPPTATVRSRFRARRPIGTCALSPYTCCTAPTLSATPPSNSRRRDGCPRPHYPPVHSPVHPHPGHGTVDATGRLRGRIKGRLHREAVAVTASPLPESTHDTVDSE